MSSRTEIVSFFYEQYDENGRLQRTRHGQLEFLTTMSYIHRFAGKGSKVLEVGAGTGRYSIALAKEGMDVTAVELVGSNLAVLRENSRGIHGLQSYQGDAANLSLFADNTFDVTLVFGPMYHLYESGYDVVEFEHLFDEKPVEWITTAGTDGLLEPIEDRPDFSIPEEDFEAFAAWYLAFAEKRELLGSTNHLLYICRKK